jgi:hypothetical protein
MAITSLDHEGSLLLAGEREFLLRQPLKGEIDPQLLSESRYHRSGYLLEAKRPPDRLLETRGAETEQLVEPSLFLLPQRKEACQLQVSRTEEQGAVLQHRAGVAPLGAAQDLLAMELELVPRRGGETRNSAHRPRRRALTSLRSLELGGEPQQRERPAKTVARGLVHLMGPWGERGGTGRHHEAVRQLLGMEDRTSAGRTPYHVDAAIPRP